MIRYTRCRYAPSSFIYVCLLFVTLGFAGCLASQQSSEPESPPAAEETAAERPLAALQLSSPKTEYTAEEAIPVELTIQNGKFDLLVPFFSVATKGAFTQITVTDANGQVVDPPRAITQEHPQKYVKRDGSSVRSIQGFDLKADAKEELTLRDLQRYYRLKPGTYTLTLAIELAVYRDSITEEHPEVIELRSDLARIRNDPNLQPTAKQDALNYYQDQIKFIEEQYAAEEKALYLPVKSLRGKAMLVSNPVTLTIVE